MEISERQRREKDLEEHQKQLEQLNNELNGTLEKLQRTQNQLIQSEKMVSLGELVAGVAHEMNTPLGTIITGSTHLENTLKEWESYEDPQGFVRLKKATQYIVSNAQTMVNILTHFNKVVSDHTSEDHQKFSLTDLINNIWQSLQYRYSEYQTSLQMEPKLSLEINSYPGVFSQIFTNLFINVFMHAYVPESSVEIYIQLEHQDDRLVIHFSDKGKGIPKTRLKKIFDPFYTTKRSEGNTGLGLYIVYNLVSQSLNGQIQCSSQQDQGTVFTITIPITV